MTSLIGKLLFSKKDKEIERLKEELRQTRKKNLKSLELINKRFSAEISNVNVEFTLKNIKNISEGK